jgi:hypothetical protein
MKGKSSPRASARNISTYDSIVYLTHYTSVFTHLDLVVLERRKFEDDLSTSLDPPHANARERPLAPPDHRTCLFTRSARSKVHDRLPSADKSVLSAKQHRGGLVVGDRVGGWVDGEAGRRGERVERLDRGSDGVPAQGQGVCQGRWQARRS